jgi:hypothetical protein
MKNQMNNIRQTLTETIRDVVEKEHNCIGTFYKNKGKRYFVSLIKEEYDDSPIVVAHIPNLDTYGSFIAATVFELYIDTESCLKCTLNGESGEDWDEVIENIQIEGLTSIMEWLQKNDFLPVPEDKLLKETDEWWNNLDMYSKEGIAGLWLLDYYNADTGETNEQDFKADCMKFWSELSKEQKIETWKTNKEEDNE